MNSRISAASWAREVNSPRRSSRRWRMEKISTMLSQEACTGGRVTRKRGWAASHARVAREVRDDPLSMTRQMSRWRGMAWLMRARKAQKAAGSLRVMISPGTWPVTTFIAAIRDTVPCRTYSNSRRSRRPGRARRVGCLRGPGLDAGFLIDAEQHRAGRRVAVQVADGPGLAEEGWVVFAVEPAADQVRLDVCLGQYPAGLAGGDRDLMLSGQVRGDTGVGPRRPGAGVLAGGGRDDQQPGVDVVDQGPAGAGPVFHRAHALGEVAAAGGPDGVGMAAQLPGDRCVGVVIGEVGAARGPDGAGMAAQLPGDRRVRGPGRGQQHDPRPPHLPLRRGLRAGDPLQFPAPPPGQADDVLAGSTRHGEPPGMTRS